MVIPGKYRGYIKTVHKMTPHGIKVQVQA